MSADDDDNWLEGKPADDAESVPVKGELFTKSRLTSIIGCAPMTMDRYVKEGAPVEARGTRKQGWKINSAKFISWLIDYKVGQAGGDPDAQGFDAAKTREKEAAAKLKEIEIDKRLGRMVDIEEVTALYEEELTILRSRLLAVPNRVGGGSEIQTAVRAEIIEALADITGRKKESRDEDAESDSD